MRYWNPRAEQALREVIQWGPDRVVLLPLYPQFSTTTTGVLAARVAGAGGDGRIAARRPRRCAATTPMTGWIDALAARTRSAIARSRRQSAWCCSRPMACRRRSSMPAIPINGRSSAPSTALRQKLGDAEVRRGDLLPEPGRPAEMDRPVDRRVHPARRQSEAAHRDRAGRFRVGAFRDPGRARYRVPASGRSQWRYLLRARADGAGRSAFHR